MKASTRRVWKGTQTFIHDLFKAKSALMKRNVSYVYGEPVIIETEHTHFYHTFNSMGRPQQNTNSVGNHFHKIDWDEDENGNLVARCGPPLRIVTKKMRNGRQRRIVEPVYFDDMRENSDNVDERIVDNHVHEMIYIRSEELALGKKHTNSLAQQWIDEKRRKESGVFNNGEFEMRPG